MSPLEVPEAPPTVADVLVQTSAVIGAVLTLGGLAWWLLRPRVTAWLGTVAADAAEARRQLDPREHGSTARKVDAALELVEQIPGLVARVRDLEDTVEPLPSVTAAVRAHDEQLVDHRRRIGNLEEAVITGRLAAQWKETP